MTCRFGAASSGYDAAGSTCLCSGSKDWYARRMEERRIKPGDRLAVLGHGIAVVEHADGNQVHAALWNRASAEDQAQGNLFGTSRTCDGRRQSGSGTQSKRAFEGGLMHRHFCEVVGHDWQCGEDCECICGLPMEGHDHSDCPVELRACARTRWTRGPDGGSRARRSRRSTSAFCPQSASSHDPTANAAVPISTPAMSLVSACGATTCTWNTAQRLKTGTSPIIAPARPRN